MGLLAPATLRYRLPGCLSHALANPTTARRVTVKDPEGNTLWENDQRQLFSKYASKRTASMREIAAAVAASRAE